MEKHIRKHVPIPETPLLPFLQKPFQLTKPKSSKPWNLWNEGFHGGGVARSMQRSINKKIGSCLLRFTPSPSPALLTRHHYSHFPLSRLLTLSQFLHSSPSFNHNLQQPSSYCKFPENGALFFAPRPILRNFLCSCGTSLDSNRHYINRSEYFFFFEGGWMVWFYFYSYSILWVDVGCLWSLQIFLLEPRKLRTLKSMISTGDIDIISFHWFLLLTYIVSLLLLF